MTSAKLQTAQNLTRLGTESAFEVLARAEALKAKGHDVINLGIGQPDRSGGDGRGRTARLNLLPRFVTLLLAPLPRL